MKKFLLPTICIVLLFAVPLVATAEAVVYVDVAGGKGYIEKIAGSTELFGGGDYVGIRFMRRAPGKTAYIEDAMFAVIWGTENQSEPNSIVIYSEITRYLGAGKVYDKNGGLVANRYPIAVKTMWVQKLEGIFEYYDADNDEICDYSRDYTGLHYSDYLWHEPVYKKVSLHTAWTRSPLNETLDPEGKQGSWTFSLTAENLSYVDIGLTNTTGDGILNRLTFTFHLEAQLVNITAAVPLFNITVDAANGYQVIDSNKIETKEFNGTRVDYGVKYDHEILGWDFDAKNPNPRLLLEWHAVVGNFVPTDVAEWIKEELLSKISGGTGNVVAETANGNVTLSEANANDTGSRPTLHTILKPARLHLLDDWQRIGSLTWITTVNVTKNEGEDPVTLNMTAQVQGHKKISVQLPRGIYVGFATLAGFSYPAGCRIYHDPQVTVSTNIMDISEITAGPTLYPYLPYIAAAIIAGVAAVSTIAILKRRK